MFMVFAYDTIIVIYIHYHSLQILTAGITYCMIYLNKNDFSILYNFSILYKKNLNK